MQPNPKQNKDRKSTKQIADEKAKLLEAQLQAASMAQLQEQFNKNDKAFATMKSKLAGYEKSIKQIPNQLIVESIQKLIWKINDESPRLPTSAELSEKLMSFGFSEAAEYLALDLRTELDFNHPQNRTILHHAAENNDLDIVRYVLSKNLQVDPQDNNLVTPLMLACQKGHFQVCRVLLEKGAKSNSQDQFTYTPLNYAICGKNDDVIKLLLSKGARKDQRTASDLNYSQ